MTPENFSALGSCLLIAAALGWIMYQCFKAPSPSEQHEDQISGL